MHFGWKTLIPVNLVWIMAIATIRVLRDRGWSPGWRPVAFVVAGLIVVLIAALMAHDAAASRRRQQEAEDDAEEERLGTTFPVPPLDLQVPTSRPAQKLAAAAPSATGGRSGATAIGERSDG
jgi:NADH-quinone oxidoreductase subunit H